mmetsp:Transcript_26900/g.67789  ORF Transcript_26900/g.67789 Transcript_26900/m.67789 type:complete len:279 (-) Transcript_26900:19-855(-)
MCVSREEVLDQAAQLLPPDLAVAVNVELREERSELLHLGFAETSVTPHPLHTLDPEAIHKVHKVVHVVSERVMQHPSGRIPGAVHAARTYESLGQVATIYGSGTLLLEAMEYLDRLRAFAILAPPHQLDKQSKVKSHAVTPRGVNVRHPITQMVQREGMTDPEQCPPHALHRKFGTVRLAKSIEHLLKLLPFATSVALPGTDDGKQITHLPCLQFETHAPEREGWHAPAKLVVSLDDRRHRLTPTMHVLHGLQDGPGRHRVAQALEQLLQSCSGHLMA